MAGQYSVYVYVWENRIGLPLLFTTYDLPSCVPEGEKKNPLPVVKWFLEFPGVLSLCAPCFKWPSSNLLLIEVFLSTHTQLRSNFTYVKRFTVR